MVEFEEGMQDDTLRSGAESAFTPTPEDLPMIVWLTGTEPWFEEFSLEADQVMNMLGVKRSRLTQIAGREMRVGRVRRGRYVSPVFRPADVEAYLSWVRAPATHVKSAGILHEAADALKSQSEELERQFAALRSDVTSDFAAVVNRNIHEAHALYRGLENGMFKALAQTSADLAARMDFVTRRQDEFAAQATLVAQAVEKLQAGQMTLLKALQEMQVRTAHELGQRIEQVQSSLNEGFEGLRRAQYDAVVRAGKKPGIGRSARPPAWRLRSRKRPAAPPANERPINTRTRLMIRSGLRKKA